MVDGMREVCLTSVITLRLTAAFAASFSSLAASAAAAFFCLAISFSASTNPFFSAASSLALFAACSVSVVW
jgi:hypothetical protein